MSSLHHAIERATAGLRRLGSGIVKNTVRLATMILLLLVAACSSSGPARNAGEVHVFISTDQRAIAEEVLGQFERSTRIKVVAEFNTENLPAEALSLRPLTADVVWSDEPLTLLLLANAGTLASYKSTSADGIENLYKDPNGLWTGFSASLRVIAYNTSQVSKRDAPRSILDLVDPKWRDQVAMADPRSGTTSFYIAAIYQHLGRDRGDELFRKLKANGLRIAKTNLDVRDFVVQGRVKIGLVDSDDAIVALRSGSQIGMMIPDENTSIGVTVVPNMVALAKAAGNPENGKKLIDFLLSDDCEGFLAKSRVAQIPLHGWGVRGPLEIPGVAGITPMRIRYSEVASSAEEAISRAVDILGADSVSHRK